MTAVPFLPGHELSAAEYDALPESHQRYELIDGVLRVSPSPTGRHQWVAGYLMAMLHDVAPEEYVVVQAVEVRLAERLRYIPDILAVTAEAYGRGDLAQYQPRDVALAVEIVSESSRGLDGIRKPAHYAAAGIPCFWRIEVGPVLVIHHMVLGPTGEYQPAGSFSDRLRTEVPWPMDLDLSVLGRDRRT